MAINLSEGSLETIMNGGDCPDPVMQILGNKKIAGNASSERYRVLISDGIHLNSFAMLATQLNHLITDKTLSDFSIIRINRHIVSTINNSGKADKRVLVILDLTVLVKGADVGEKIGNPAPMTEGGASNPTSAMNGSSTSTAVSRIPSEATNGVRVATPAASRSLVRHDSTPGSMGMAKIISLSPYQNRWTIKARVSNKSGIRTWSNARGNGKLFSVDLIDDTGEIRATAFNEQCDKYYEMLEMNKVYVVSKCALKPANKKFSSVNHEFEMSFTRDTIVMPCEEEDDSIPTISYNFTPLSQIPTANMDTLGDFIGICVSTSDVVPLISRTTQKELKKRDVSIVDQSQTKVDVTLWGTQAEEFDGSGTPILAIKGGKIGEFGGSRNISLLANSSLQLNPDIPEAHKLRGWYDTQDTTTMDFNYVSQRTGISGGNGENDKIITLKDFRNRQLGTADKADYFTIMGTITHVRTENALYQACPLGDCKRKVVDQNNGFYRCEKCGKEVHNFVWRMLMNVHVVDWSGEVWVTLFQETAEQIVGMTAAELGAMKEETNNLGSAFKKVRFAEYTLRLRAKQDTYNDETRVKISCVNAKVPDRKAHINYLIGEIKSLAGIGCITA